MQLSHQQARAQYSPETWRAVKRRRKEHFVLLNISKGIYYHQHDSYSIGVGSFKDNVIEYTIYFCFVQLCTHSGVMKKLVPSSACFLRRSFHELENGNDVFLLLLFESKFRLSYSFPRLNKRKNTWSIDVVSTDALSSSHSIPSNYCGIDTVTPTLAVKETCRMDKCWKHCFTYDVLLSTKDW